MLSSRFLNFAKFKVPLNMLIERKKLVQFFLSKLYTLRDNHSYIKQSFDVGIYI